MAKYFPLPNGKYIKVPDNMPYEEASDRAQREFPDLYGPATPAPGVEAPESGFIPAARAGLSSMQGSGALLAGRMGLMDTKAATDYNKQQEEFQQKIFKPTEDWGLTKVAETFGGALPYLAAPAAIAAAPEALLSAPVALGLQALSAYAPNAANNIAKQVSSGTSLEKTNLGGALATAIPQTALDFGAAKLLPGVRGLLGSKGIKLTEEEARKVAEQALRKTVVDYSMATGKAMGEVGIAMAGKEALTRLQAGLNLTDEEARKDYLESFLGGAAFGAVVGPYGHMKEKRAAIQNAKAEGDALRAKQAAALTTEGKEETPGVPPATAGVKAEATPDELAELVDSNAEIESATEVRTGTDNGTLPPPVGESIGVAGESGAGTTPGGVEGVESTGVGAPESAVGGAGAGEGNLPPPLTNELTQTAKNLLKAVDRGGIPTELTDGLKKIAADNGIEVTATDTAVSVVAKIRAKAGTKPEEAKPEVKPEEANPEAVSEVAKLEREIAGLKDNLDDFFGNETAEQIRDMRTNLAVLEEKLALLKGKPEEVKPAVEATTTATEAPATKTPFDRSSFAAPITTPKQEAPQPVEPKQAKLLADIERLGALDKDGMQLLAVSANRLGIKKKKGESNEVFRDRVVTAMKLEAEIARPQVGGEGKPLSAVTPEVIAEQDLQKKPLQISKEQQDLYEETRQHYNENVAEAEQQHLPEFSKLTPHQKILYFRDHISENTQAEHDKAAAALSEHIETGRSASEDAVRAAIREATEAGKSEAEIKAAGEAAKKAALAEHEARDSYSRNRVIESRADNLSYSFPNWGDLSQASRDLYTKHNTNDSALSQRKAFEEVRKQHELEKAEKLKAAEKEHNETEADRQSEIKAAADNKKAESERPKVEVSDDTAKKLGWDTEQKESTPEGQAEVAARNAAFDAEYKARLERLKKAEAGEKSVPEGIKELIKKGDMQGVLNYLRKASPNYLYRAIAEQLHKTGINSKIELVESLPEGRLAQYDPKTDTVQVTKAGLTDKSLMHELVHAATIKVLDAYKNNYKSLTEDQIAAVEHLQAMMDEAKTTLGDKYPNAFENIKEFLSHSMTDHKLQEDLQNLEWSYAQPSKGKGKGEAGKKAGPTPLITDILPESKNLWTNFTKEIARLLGLNKEIFKKDKVVGSNVLMETFGAFEHLLSATEAGIEHPTLPAKRSKAPTNAARTPDEVIDQPIIAGKPTRDSVRDILNTPKIGERIVTLFQNAQRPIKNLQDRYDRLGLIEHTGKGINNVWTQITGASSKARYVFDTQLRGFKQNIDQSVLDFAKANKMGVEKALQTVHYYMLALHEPERRAVLYMLTVPLDFLNKSVKIGSKLYTPEEARQAILKSVIDERTTDAQAKAYRAQLDKIIDTHATNDATRTTKFLKDKDGNPKPIDAAMEKQLFDKTSDRYRVGGTLTQEELKLMRQKFDNETPENKARLKEIAGHIKDYQDETAKINKEANYWAPGVSNLISMYGFENYIPLKGKGGKDDSDVRTDPRRLAGDLQEKENAMGGRHSDSDNSVLQTLADGGRAAARLGRKDLTLSIKNAALDGILKADLKDGKLENIKFEDRINNPDVMDAAKGQKVVYHYETNGSITVIKLHNNAEAEAIRRTYREANPLLDKLNAVTGFIGRTHTAYNLAFGPVNFSRDTLTNSGFLSAQFGPAKAAQLITEIGRQVGAGGLQKAWKVAHLYETGRAKEAEKLGHTDEFIKDMLEYMVKGRVSYAQGISTKGQLAEMVGGVGKNGVIKDVKGFFHNYSEMFELANRTATYRVMKDIFRKKNLLDGMSHAEAEANAQVRAAEYTKNLANFEQVGQYGKALGAIFMFFRPGATGAMRAIDALSPAFQSAKDIEGKIRAQATGTKATEAQILKAIKEAKGVQANARVTTAALMGMGVATYQIARMMSGEDDKHRNKVETDDPSRWGRYARFFIPGMTNAVQIPWAYGLGAFASAGAQIAMMGSGTASVKEGLGNIAVLGLDNFLPLPISKMNPLDNPLAFVLDSVAPSPVKPFLEYVMNKNSMGNAIYNNRQNRASNAYTGGDNIPQIYKSTSTWLYDTTKGGIDITPNVLYFFANNYMDGIAQIASASTNLGLMAAGKMDFDAKKTALPIASFIGTPSNYDSRKFSEAEQKVSAIKSRMDGLKADPKRLAAFIADHPEYPGLVHYYEQQTGGPLRNIRAAMNKVREDRSMSIREKAAQLKEMQPIQDTMKQNALMGMKAISDNQL
jgi:hypothetical protein